MIDLYREQGMSESSDLMFYEEEKDGQGGRE